MTFDAQHSGICARRASISQSERRSAATKPSMVRRYNILEVSDIKAAGKQMEQWVRQAK
jgi:hypothetical protein